MATTLAVTTTSRSGTDLAATATTADVAGNNWANTGAELLYIKNGGVGSITLTEVITQTVDGQAVTNRTVTVGAGILMILGPYPPAVYGTTCSVTYSGVTSVTVLVFKAGS